MIDFETLGIKVNARLLEFSAVLFDINKIYTLEELNNLPNISYYIRCDVDSNAIEIETLGFWLKSNPEGLYKMLFSDEKERVHEVNIGSHIMRMLLKENVHNVHIWARGIDFDMKFVERCFSNIIKKPYRYDAVRDVRTVIDVVKLTGQKMPVMDEEMHKALTKHDSLDDCKIQIWQVTSAINILKNWLPTNFSEYTPTPTT